MPSVLFCGAFSGPRWPAMLTRLVRLTVAAMLLSGVVAGHAARSAESLLSPASRERVSLHWDSVPLRPGLERLATAHKVTVFLDRRVDPRQLVTVSAQDIPLSDLLSQIARRSHSGVAILDTVAYIGPERTAQMIRTLAALQEDRARELTRFERKPWDAKVELKWPRLTVPRQWIGQVSSRRGVEIAGLERIPHDLWPAGALPAMSFSDQITLLLAGFDLTLSTTLDGRQFELVPIKGDERIVRRYKKPRQDHGPTLNTLARRAPDAEISVDGRTIVVRGRVEDHDLIAEAFTKSPTTSKRRPKSRTPTKKTVFTLRIENQPVGPVLRQLGKQLDLSITFDDAAIERAAISLEQLVSFEVENGSIDDLLAALLTPAGLTFDRRERAVRVFPAKPE